MDTGERYESDGSHFDMKFIPVCLWGIESWAESMCKERNAYNFLYSTHLPSLTPY